MANDSKSHRFQGVVKHIAAFQRKRVDGSKLKLLLTDFIKQILKLVDQLYAPYYNKALQKSPTLGNSTENCQQRQFGVDSHNGRRLI